MCCAGGAAGFAWLTYNTRNGSLAIESTPNQDNPMSSSLGYGGNTPILALDVVRVLHCCTCVSFSTHCCRAASVQPRTAGAEQAAGW